MLASHSAALAARRDDTLRPMTPRRLRTVIASGKLNVQAILAALD